MLVHVPGPVVVVDGRGLRIHALPSGEDMDIFVHRPLVSYCNDIKQYVFNHKIIE